MRDGLKRLVAVFTASSLLGGAALVLYTAPAWRRLPSAKGRSLDGVVSIDDAIFRLQMTGKRGWELVAAAQKLVNAKMAYSRRNGWDTPARAFRRGLGYCHQQALALLIILRRLGIEARPVYAFRARFPPKQIHEYWEPGGISGHVWLAVRVDGVEKDVCPGHPDNEPGKVHFAILSRRRPYGPVMRLFGQLGSILVNVQRDNAALKRMQQEPLA
jgi:hypothetical protein